MTFVNFAAFAAADVELHHLLGLYPDFDRADSRWAHDSRGNPM